MRQQIQTQEQEFDLSNYLRTQSCPVCSKPMGDMPGSRDAVCHSCGYKDPCCE